MAPRSKTAPSTPRLSEYAKSFVYPEGITRTVWPRVEAKGAELGLGFDWWQSQAGIVILGYRDDGRYAATVGGVGMSIPRQVGKTYFVLAMLVVLCILFPGLQVVWTAHHLRTSTKTFTALRGIARRRKVAPHILSLRSGNGEQQVEFRNGSLIMFGARAQGFGRGFDEIDVEVFDEAQILDTKALEDMIAATNQARHEHGALLFFMGTPPRPSDPSEAFRSRRSEARAGDATDSVWVEIGADPTSNPNDEAQWPAMNPSYPLRTPRESMLRLRKNLKDDDSWNREGRGVWDADGVGGAVSTSQWKSLADPNADRGAQISFGYDVTEDRSAWIAVAWPRPDGKVQVQLVEEAALPAYRAPERVVEVSRAWNGRVRCTRAFEADFENLGLAVIPMASTDFAAACGAFADAITEGVIAHGNQSNLNTAVKAAKWRYAGTDGTRAFQLKDMPEVGPLAAAVRAYAGVLETYDVLDSFR